MAETKDKQNLIPARRIESAILTVRGQRVLLDRDLAVLYGVETRVLNQAVRRNRARFPSDFMYELTRGEILRMSPIVISPDGMGELKYSKSVFAFTEQGVAMLSSVLNGPRAVQVNIEIMRAFVRLREILAANADLSRKLAALEHKYDGQFKVVFTAIRSLMGEKKKPRREIGFHTLMVKTGEVNGAQSKARKL
jgi:hypothetical protein